MLTPSQWQSYKDIINKASESFNKDILIWRRFVRSRQRYGEDTQTSEVFTDIDLDCLMSYNVFRTWPMTVESKSGALDSESIVAILNKKYLEDNGYLNSDGFFDMNPGKDKFIHQGIEYRSSGETGVSQAGDEAIMFYVILKRQETPTGTDKY